MNTNNVMAMAVQPASPKVATNAKPVGTKGSSKASAKANSGAFDDVLDKASTDFANSKDVQKASGSQNDDTALDNGQSDSQTTSADLLAMWLAASNTSSDQVVNEVEVPTSAVGTAAVNVQLSTEAQAEVVELPASDSKITANLQSVLPQDNKVLQQNSNFLAMLSGQQVKTVATSELVNQVVSDSATMTNSETVVSQAMTDILSAQLANSANKANVNKEAAAMTVAPIVQATAETANQVADFSQTAKANELATLMTNNTSLADDLAALNANSKLNLTTNLTVAEPMTKANQPAETMVNDTSLADLIDSSKLTISEEVAIPAVTINVSEQGSVKANDVATSTSTSNSNNQLTATPSAVLPNQATLTDDSAMNNGQQPQQQPNQSANNSATAAVLANLSGDVEAMTELPEEAVGDRVMTKDTTTSENTVTTSNSASISVFQQDLQDSLTGATKTNQATSNQAANDYDIPKHIIDQARLIRRAENTEMVIKLNPEHLGELTLKVSVTSNGSVNASFHSDNAQVRTIIENSLVNLRQELNNQGLKVDNVDVYAGLADGQLPQGEGQQAWQQQQSQQGQASVRVNMTADDYLDEVAEVAAQATTTTTNNSDGVDYRI